MASSDGATVLTRTVISAVSSSFVDLDGQHAQVLDQAQRQATDQAAVRVSGQVCLDLVKSAAALQLRRRCPRGVELVQMPAQPGDDAGPFSDQVFAMIDQQPQFRSTVEARDRQVRFAQCGPRHRQGVDRIGFAVAARRVPDMGH